MLDRLTAGLNKSFRVLGRDEPSLPKKNLRVVGPMELFTLMAVPDVARIGSLCCSTGDAPWRDLIRLLKSRLQTGKKGSSAKKAKSLIACT